jgi:hypothetical protein
MVVGRFDRQWDTARQPVAAAPTLESQAKSGAASAILPGALHFVNSATSDKYQAAPALCAMAVFTASA